jgi:hypothetical protein
MIAAWQPTAIIAVRLSLCGDSFTEKRLEHYAKRLGYVVVATIDTDEISDLWMNVTSLQPDAVITLDETHIEHCDATRLCDLITLDPEAQYSKGHYERLQTGGRPEHLLPKRIPGASGLAPHPNHARPRATTAADWNRLVPAILGALRARNKTAHTT